MAQFSGVPGDPGLFWAHFVVPMVAHSSWGLGLHPEDFWEPTGSWDLHLDDLGGGGVSHLWDLESHLQDLGEPKGGLGLHLEGLGISPVGFRGLGSRVFEDWESL